MLTSFKNETPEREASSADRAPISPTPSATRGYAVLDVETTGLNPARMDRIVEIAIVLVSDDGRIEEEWSTLVNPQRDVGPTRIHGITATDVLAAPTFQDVMGRVLGLLEGRVLVAHNADFDVRFLLAELRQAGKEVADPTRVPQLCTMRWSTAFVSSSSRRLIDCCAAAGVDLTNAHTAAGDARATAELLRHYLRASPPPPPWQDVMHQAVAYRWPTAAGFGEALARSRAQVVSEPKHAWLERVVSHMPRAGDAQVDSYLAVLEMALLDGFLAEHEKEALVETAQNSGLDRDTVLDLHKRYLRAMGEVALEDGVVTESERADLKGVAALLGLPSDAVKQALEAVREGSHEGAYALSASAIQLEAGDRVVFTGDMNRARDEWERDIRRFGLETGGVTKATKIVVAGDPNSLSGKAAKARTYGIPIVTESAFARLLEKQGSGQA
nr:exonuclease domain-containing protein [Ornithinimicrobium sp. HY1793]